MKTDCDIAVIGAGVVGCAISRELSLRYPYLNISVLEKWQTAGLETSNRNSGVIHSGLHQNPGSLKADLNLKGSKLAVEYLTSKNLPIMQPGMLIIIPRDIAINGISEELKSFLNLIRNGRSQNIRFRFLLPAGIKKLEPNIKVLCGIFIPGVWVIDPLEFVKSLQKDAQAEGVNFLFNQEVIEIVIEDKGYLLITQETEIKTRLLINAAGLYAGEISAMAGFPNYATSLWRGEYYEICKEKQEIVSRLIYPVMASGYPSKGVHFGPRVDGRLFLGPNARLVPSKDYYTLDKTPPSEFLEIVRRFCPDITEKDIQWAYSGIRPKLPNNDFVIRMDRENPPLLNLVGIESPGLSASMAIAKYAADLISPHIL